MAVLPTLLEELECIWIICLPLEFLVDNCYGLSMCMAAAEEQHLPIAAVIASIFQYPESPICSPGEPSLVLSPAQ